MEGKPTQLLISQKIKEVFEKIERKKGKKCCFVQLSQTPSSKCFVFESEGAQEDLLSKNEPLMTTEECCFKLAYFLSKNFQDYQVSLRKLKDQMTNIIDEINEEIQEKLKQEKKAIELLHQNASQKVPQKNLLKLQDFKTLLTQPIGPAGRERNGSNFSGALHGAHEPLLEEQLEDVIKENGWIFQENLFDQEKWFLEKYEQVRQSSMKIKRMMPYFFTNSVWESQVTMRVPETGWDGGFIGLSERQLPISENIRFEFPPNPLKRPPPSNLEFGGILGKGKTKEDTLSQRVGKEGHFGRNMGNHQENGESGIRLEEMRTLRNNIEEIEEEFEAELKKESGGVYFNSDPGCQQLPIFFKLEGPNSKSTQNLPNERVSTNPHFMPPGRRGSPLRLFERQSDDKIGSKKPKQLETKHESQIGHFASGFRARIPKEEEKQEEPFECFDQPGLLPKNAPNELKRNEDTSQDITFPLLNQKKENGPERKSEKETELKRAEMTKNQQETDFHGPIKSPFIDSSFASITSISQREQSNSGNLANIRALLSTDKTSHKMVNPLKGLVLKNAQGFTFITGRKKGENPQIGIKDLMKILETEQNEERMKVLLNQILRIADENYNKKKEKGKELINLVLIRFLNWDHPYKEELLKRYQMLFRNIRSSPL